MSSPLQLGVLLTTLLVPRCHGHSVHAHHLLALILCQLPPILGPSSSGYPSPAPEA
jgi:hypothetical protein